MALKTGGASLSGLADPPAAPGDDPAGRALKKSLREFLAGRGEAAGWLDGIFLRQGSQGLRAFFIHPLFARWFFEQKRTVFEEALGSLRKKAGVDYAALHARPAPFASKKSPRLFDSFLDNGKNAEALAAARQAAEGGLAWSALIFYGAPGTGKTHLLGAIRQELEDRHGSGAAILRDAASFCESDPLLCRGACESGFWLRRVLLLDNLQGLAGRPDLQRRLAIRLGAPERGLAVFAWTGDARGLSRLAGELSSRLASGLAIALTEPDLETRLDFLERECQGLGLGKGSLLQLARSAATFPALLGLALKARRFVETRGAAPGPEQLEELALGQAGKNPDWRQIASAVGARLGVPADDIAGGGRKAEIVLARQAAMYLCRRRLGLSYPELGRLFGGKDHTTAIHAIKKIEALRETDKVLHNLLTELETGALE